jgi:glycolate oxidase
MRVVLFISIAKKIAEIGCDVVLDAERYLYDETPVSVRPKPSKNVVVVKPANTEHVSEIMKIANREKIPVFVRGGGTGLSGGAVPVLDGIVISTEKMKNIEVDPDNLCITCDAGVTLRELTAFAEKAGLSFPPHPGSDEATVGGMVSTNAGGVRAMKYGVMRNYVLGIEAVLPSGEILRLGGKTIKNNAGYNLMHLLIGSEGTLAIVTRVVIKLLPPPGKTFTLAVPFNEPEGAIKTVTEILKSGIVPLALEYIEKEALEIGEKVAGKRWPPKGEANLMIILDGRNEDELIEISEQIHRISSVNGAMDVFVAQGAKEQKHLLEIRSLIYEGIRDMVIEILDVSVPPSKIPEYLKRCNLVAEKMGFKVVNYGHAGDGNIHQHPFKIDDWESKYPFLKNEFFRIAKELGGSITGEHGIGIVKKDDLKEFISETEMRLMRKIKQIFDPFCILNPDKVVDCN